MMIGWYFVYKHVENLYSSVLGNHLVHTEEPGSVQQGGGGSRPVREFLDSDH